uniref:Z-ring associated protein G n=1 Tax=Candidatus Kentrum sp. FW TaxID=2126338 RepID=A0A450T763_9GAMM|nr:MAG: Protein of unknown function (DUF1043) [Candidatus Kentron sp. FW]
MMTEYGLNWVLGIGGAMLVVGIGIGLLGAYFLLPSAKRAKRLQKDLDTVNTEFGQYRERVTEHFSTTSDLFHDLTSRYRGLYDHLALGAQSLCREASNTHRLDFSDVGLLTGRNPWVAGAIPGSDAGKDAEKPETKEGESVTKVETVDLSSLPDRKEV